MMDGIILAALALLSVPVLLIVILVKVCGLENKVADLTKRIGVNNLTQKHVTAAQAGLAICSEPSRATRVPSRPYRKRCCSPTDGFAGRGTPHPSSDIASQCSLRSGIWRDRCGRRRRK